MKCQRRHGVSKKLRGANAGFSLIEFLVVVAIMGVFAAGSASMSMSQVKMMRSMELRSDLMVLKATIANNIDCAKTSRAVCSGKPIIYARTNKMRLPGAKQMGQVPKTKASPTKPGVKEDPFDPTPEEWQVAAQCKKATVKSYDVYLFYARKKGDGFARDPTTGQLYEWRDLFKGPICQGYMKGAH